MRKIAIGLLIFVIALEFLIRLFFNSKTLENEKIFDLYQLNKNIAEKLCKKFNVEYLEMPNALLRGGDFLDICHLTPMGHEIKADFLSKKLYHKLTKKK